MGAVWGLRGASMETAWVRAIIGKALLWCGIAQGWMQGAVCGMMCAMTLYGWGSTHGCSGHGWGSTHGCSGHVNLDGIV